MAPPLLEQSRWAPCRQVAGSWLGEGGGPAAHLNWGQSHSDWRSGTTSPGSPFPSPLSVSTALGPSWATAKKKESESEAHNYRQNGSFCSRRSCKEFLTVKWPEHTQCQSLVVPQGIGQVLDLEPLSDKHGMSSMSEDCSPPFALPNVPAGDLRRQVWLCGDFWCAKGSLGTVSFKNKFHWIV